MNRSLNYNQSQRINQNQSSINLNQFSIILNQSQSIPNYLNQRIINNEPISFQLISNYNQSATTKSTKQSTRQSINQAINSPINQLIYPNQSFDQPVTQPMLIKREPIDDRIQFV